MTPEAIVRVKGLVKDFRPGLGRRKTRVLHGIDFEVREGEIFGFIGPNGAGKTTTLKVLMGLIHATAGEAEVLGHPVRDTAYRAHIGYAPESPYFYDFLTGREILDFYARLTAVPNASRAARVAEVLEQVGLTHAADTRLRTYSKGMLQRVGIAQAVVHDPSVVFLDEPMSGLDPVGRKEIRDLIVALNQAGKTIMMNTHILSDVEMICDRVAIIVEGRIAYQGAIDGFDEAGDKIFDVTLASLAPDFVEEAATRFGAEPTGRGDRVTFSVAEKHVGELVESALRRGGQVLEVLGRRADLETLFLSAVNDRPESDTRTEEGAA